jgi:hypothetical protein
VGRKNDEPESGLAKFLSDYAEFLRELKAGAVDILEPFKRLMLSPKEGSFERLLRFSLVSHLFLAAWLLYQSGLNATPVFNWLVLPIVTVFLGLVAGGVVSLVAYLVWTIGGTKASEIRWPTAGLLLYTVWLLPGIIPVWGLALIRFG